jgi:hypothetical protein
LEVESNKDHDGSAILLGTFAALAVSIRTSAVAHADDEFIACPSGREHQAIFRALTPGNSAGS